MNKLTQLIGEGRVIFVSTLCPFGFLAEGLSRVMEVTNHGLAPAEPSHGSQTKVTRYRRRG